MLTRNHCNINGILFKIRLKTINYCKTFQKRTYTFVEIYRI